MISFVVVVYHTKCYSSPQNKGFGVTQQCEELASNDVLTVVVMGEGRRKTVNSSYYYPSNASSKCLFKHMCCVQYNRITACPIKISEFFSPYLACRDLKINL